MIIFIYRYIMPPHIVKIGKFRLRQKMAMFDYDWTLVKPLSNGTFSKDLNDWRWMTDITTAMFRNNKRDKVIPKITYYVFRKKYVKPTIEEGFYNVINI